MMSHVALKTFPKSFASICRLKCRISTYAQISPKIHLNMSKDVLRIDFEKPRLDYDFILYFQLTNVNPEYKICHDNIYHYLFPLSNNKQADSLCESLILI